MREVVHGGGGCRGREAGTRAGAVGKCSGRWGLDAGTDEVTGHSTALQDSGVLGPGGELPSVATRVWRGWRLGRCEKCEYKNKPVKL